MQGERQPTPQAPQSGARSEPKASEATDLDYALPAAAIAQQPAQERDGARLLHLDRTSGGIADRRVLDLPSLLTEDDLLVVNATRVLPARLRGHKRSGGVAEALLLGPGTAADRYRALLKMSGRLRPGIELVFEAPGRKLAARIASVRADGCVELAFDDAHSPYALGETPLPPYIRRSAREPLDETRYQTVFARVPGSVAAPTAGLHLSERLLSELHARGVRSAELLLHIGEGTFRPLAPEQLATGLLHAEHYELPEATAQAIDETRARGGRVVAVGTTTTRVLESCACAGRRVMPGAGETQLFLRPGSRFQVVDVLLTNFHLPRSSLLLLVAAFAGRETLLDAYRHAIAAGYRFYSYGDAMLVS